MQGVQVQFRGRLVADPEIRFLPSGLPVAKFRAAVERRQFNKTTNLWENKDTTFLNVEAWRGLAENIAETLTKGTDVLVVGTLVQKDYTTKTGENRSTYNVVDAMVGPELTKQTAQLSKTTPATAAPQPATPPPTPPAAAGSPPPGSIMDDPPF